MPCAGCLCFRRRFVRAIAVIGPFGIAIAVGQSVGDSVGGMVMAGAGGMACGALTYTLWEWAGRRYRPWTTCS
jgi:hypothetical protein